MLHYRKDGRAYDGRLFDLAFCVFDGKYDYFVRRAERMYGLEPGFFAPYFDAFARKGYPCELERGVTNGLRLQLHFRSRVSGFVLCMDLRKIHQVYFALEREIGAKSALEHDTELPEEARAFIDERVTLCTKCMNCTNGGKRKGAWVAAERDGGTRTLCPNSLWIGKCLPYMDRQTMDHMCAFIEAQDRYGK